MVVKIFIYHGYLSRFNRFIIKRISPSAFLAVKAIIGGLAKVSYKLVPHRGCTFVGYVVQQVPDAPCNPALQGFPEMRAVGGIGRDTVRIDDA